MTQEGMPQNALTRMKIDFHKSRVDLFAVQRYISDKLLGPDTVQFVGGGSMAGQEDAGSGFAAWLGDDNRLVDASEANRRFHSEIPILQGCEDIELAFKGRRDMLLFTTKRVIFVDVQGFLGFGKKVEYTSMPYTSVSAFSVRTAGNSFDKDSELCLWLDFDDVFYPVRENQNNQDQEQPPPIPRYSCIEIDFDRDKIDVFMLHRYCSERMMRVDAHAMKPYTDPVLPDLIVPSPPDAGQKLIDWIGDNAAAIDPEAVNEKLHEAGLLQDDESVAFAFKTGRDSLFMTNKRLLVLNVKVSTLRQHILIVLFVIASDHLGPFIGSLYCTYESFSHRKMHASFREFLGRGEITCPFRGIWCVCGQSRVRVNSTGIWS